MPQKKPASKRSVSPVGLRPGQDFVSAKSASSFPSVGMTLNTYQQSGVRPMAGSGQAAALPRPAVKPLAGKRPGRLRRLFSLKRVFLTLLILVLGTAGWVGFKFLYNAHKLFGGSIFGLLSSTKLNGEDQGRVNILLAGNSADDPGHQGADLTDSIMIISIDTKNNTAFMLSVPRDLWVNIPGAGYNKINDAYVVGQNDNFSQDGYPSGGMGLLEDVVQQDLGIPIDYYALVDYNAFKQAVDAVGGIDINIQSTDPRGLYDPNRDYTTHGPLVDLSNGWHHLDGEQALDLARARGDPSPYGIAYGFPSSDFDRTAHQRQMLVALKNKAITAGVLANPARLSNLFDAIGNNVKTDFTLSQVHRLYDLVKPINSNSIQSVSLNDADGQNLLQNYTAYDGESSLIPAAGLDDFSQIQNFVQRLTSNNPVVREDAQVVALNASNTVGVAAAARTSLTSQHINVVSIGDALTTQATTTIIDNSGGKMPATKALLAKLYGNHFTTTNPYTGYTADFIILLGNDQSATTTN